MLALFLMLVKPILFVLTTFHNSLNRKICGLVQGCSHFFSMRATLKPPNQTDLHTAKMKNIFLVYFKHKEFCICTLYVDYMLNALKKFHREKSPLPISRESDMFLSFY